MFTGEGTLGFPLKGEHKQCGLIKQCANTSITRKIQKNTDLELFHFTDDNQTALKKSII